MSLVKRIDDDLTSALKHSEKIKLSVLRLIKSAIQNQRIQKGKDLTDDEVLSLLSSMAKQRRESIEQFSMGGREDLAAKEKAELAIIQGYLPEPISEKEIDDMIEEAVAASSAESEADIGKVMKMLMPRVKGLADGRLVNNKVRKRLHSLRK
ncbi:MAG: GatB/YqeY domain-containing protein [Nitrospiraceae bacterium]|nr:MAG: GatB/YqeY domain-containing protein [Nitrospiraceae bacterium]